MTTVEAVAPARSSALSAWAVALLGVAALLARPWLVRTSADPTAVLVTVFVCIGMAGAWWMVPVQGARSVADRRGVVVVTAVGVGAFALGRLLGGGEPAVSEVAGYLVLNTLAAVAEEALFRRLLYGLLEPHGAGVAVAGSAAAFAAVHLTVWGAWALPLDLAAGLVLSWQRWASGRWTVPAVTHVAANVLVVL